MTLVTGRGGRHAGIALFCRDPLLRFDFQKKFCRFQSLQGCSARMSAQVKRSETHKEDVAFTAAGSFNQKPAIGGHRSR